jgi:hypothetical protein
MPMPIKIRVSFSQDANFVERLKTAIDMDRARDADWKREIIGHLNSVVILLRQADIQKLQRENNENESAE